MTAAHIVVTGVVQGVGFRYFSRDEARKLGLVGWAKNLIDGRVEIEIVGEKPFINDYVKVLHIGPPASHVTALEVTWLDEIPDYDDFKIRF